MSSNFHYSLAATVISNLNFGVNLILLFVEDENKLTTKISRFTVGHAFYAAGGGECYLYVYVLQGVVMTQYL